MAVLDQILKGLEKGRETYDTIRGSIDRKEEIAGQSEKPAVVKSVLAFGDNVDLMKKLISEQVIIYKRTNVVKSEKFSEIIQSTMNRYLNGMLTNEEVIQELLNLAKHIAVAQKEGEQLGLTSDELISIINQNAKLDS